MRDDEVVPIASVTEGRRGVSDVPSDDIKLQTFRNPDHGHAWYLGNGVHVDGKRKDMQDHGYSADEIKNLRM